MTLESIISTWKSANNSHTSWKLTLDIPPFFNPIKFVRIMDYVWPVDSSCLLENEDHRHSFRPYSEIMKTKVISKVSQNPNTHVTTIAIEDRDNCTDVVGNSVANVNYFYEYLRSLGNADAWGFAEYLKRFMSNIMYGFEANSVA
jgi:hypothetical protein